MPAVFVNDCFLFPWHHTANQTKSPALHAHVGQSCRSGTTRMPHHPFGVTCFAPLCFPSVELPSLDALFSTLHDAYQLRFAPACCVSDSIEVVSLQCIPGPHLPHFFGLSKFVLRGDSSHFTSSSKRLSRPSLTAALLCWQP